MNSKTGEWERKRKKMLWKEINHIRKCMEGKRGRVRDKTKMVIRGGGGEDIPRFLLKIGDGRVIENVN